MYNRCQVSDRELYDKLLASAPPGSGHAAFVAERAELLLQQSAKLGLYTRCLHSSSVFFTALSALPPMYFSLQSVNHLACWAQYLPYFQGGTSHSVAVAVWPLSAARAQCLDYLGRHFRTMLNMPKSSSVEVAHHLLGEFVFIHLDQKRPADKLALLMQMLHKLYAL
eukprot:scaffold47205_cov20-Tisochrysis_lutea.AAC.1